MSLSQIELVWVRVRVERECFWVNLREDNKVSESKMAVSESNMAEFKMAAIIKLSQNEQWSFLCKMAESKMAEFKMDAEFKIAAIIMLTENERVKFFYANAGNQSWQLWVSLRGKTKMAESKMAKLKMAEFKMAAIIKLSQNEWVKFIFVKMAESKMAAIIKLSQNEWLWVRLN